MEIQGFISLTVYQNMCSDLIDISSLTQLSIETEKSCRDMKLPLTRINP